MSLERSMDVTEYGKSELTNLRAHGEMPIRYKVERDEYILYGEVDRWSIRPASVFSVEGKSVIGAQIRVTGIRCFASVEDPAPAEVQHGRFVVGSKRFKWNPIGHLECPNEIEPNDVNRRIEILVLNDRGQELFREVILFDIVNNGIHREYDGP